MSKDDPDSYFDWLLSFKKKSNKKTKIGISEQRLKEFLKDWKKENLEIEDDTGPNG